VCVGVKSGKLYIMEKGKVYFDGLFCLPVRGITHYQVLVFLICETRVALVFVYLTLLRFVSRLRK